MDGADESLETRTVAFGPFTLIPSRRRLERSGVAIELGGRAFDILVALVERPHEVVSKRDLLSRAWPGLHVDDSSLRVTVSALRKTLGDGHVDDSYVTNVPGRGYCFVSPVTIATDAVTAPPALDPPASPRRIPALTAKVVGREDAIGTIASQLLGQRFVSVVGSGGVGKTTVALSVAHSLSESFGDDVRFIDFGTLGDPQRVVTAVAAAVGVVVAPGDPIQSLRAALGRKRMLILLDGCEHLAESVTSLAEAIFHDCPEIYLLATSRESLRAEGECVYRLQPLECPPDDPDMSAEKMLEYPAARLFVDRLSTRGSLRSLGEAEVPLLGAICRRLDGIALALELVAGRVDSYGIRGIAELLGGQLALHLSGKRTAIPRHRTLSATIDWSYKLLTEDERRILRRLSVFTGTFSLEAAQKVVVNPQEAAAQNVLESIAALVAKSLISVASDVPSLRYRLLDTTRMRLRHHLAESGEADAICARHADYYRDRIEGMASAPPPASQCLAEREEIVLNIRGALEFAFSPRGASVDRIRLAAGAARLFLEMSLLTECRDWADRAISAMGANVKPDRPAMELWTALALSRMFMEGGDEAVHTAFMKAIELAEVVGDLSVQLRLQSGMHLFEALVGNFNNSLTRAASSRAVAEKLGDPGTLSLATGMLASAYHLAGDQANAQIHCEACYACAASLQDPLVWKFGYDPRAVSVLCRVYWLRGYSGRAVAVARETIERGRKLDHPMSFCMSLIPPASVFFWVGDLESAASVVETLRVHSARLSSIAYHAMAVGLSGKLLAAKGDRRAGIERLRESLKELRVRRHQAFAITIAADLAELLAAEGLHDEALALITTLLRQDQEGGGSWYTPEILRVKGVVLGARKATYMDAIECLMKSKELSPAHSSLAWELRTEISLANLQRQSGRRYDHRSLQDVYDRFADGHRTPDLEVARRLLAEARPSRAG
jgi:predicted ATPase/DNA-binding winged helix-turn-helix (wHTH) protein